VLVGEAADEGLLQQPRLARRRVRASSARTLGSRSPAISAASMARPETPKLSEATTERLIWASSSSLLHPLVLGGPHRHQVGAVAGQVPQPPDRRRRDEAGPQQLPLGHLAPPHRIQLVGLGPAGQVLDIAGIDRPDLKPVGLQQVERGLPGVAGGLHHHPGHAQRPPAGPPSPAATWSSSGRSPPPPVRLPGASGLGTRTQQTNCALPISSAATRAMTSSLSCASSSTLRLLTSAATGAVARGSRQARAEADPRAQGNTEGPMARRPASDEETVSHRPRSNDVSERPRPIFTPEGASRPGRPATKSVFSDLGPGLGCPAGGRDRRP
jgi:hypothetical protein